MKIILLKYYFCLVVHWSSPILSEIELSRDISTVISYYEKSGKT